MIALSLLPIAPSKFSAGWLPMLALTAAIDPAPELAMLEINLAGVEIPVVTALLAALGVLAARPLARRQESALSMKQFLLVTAIMLIVVELWVIDMQPRWLFAFVVAIGLGFSGYSLIELLGSEMRGLVSSAFALARSKIGELLGMAPPTKVDSSGKMQANDGLGQGSERTQGTDDE